MDIKPLGSMPSRRTPADYFTGTVWQEPIIEAPAPARIRAAWVRFEPRARTAWHTHPLGQTLHVVSGVGRVALWGGPVREIRAGDTVWIAPGEKHWHGAGPETTMGLDIEFADAHVRALAQGSSAAGVGKATAGKPEASSVPKPSGRRSGGDSGQGSLFGA